MSKETSGASKLAQSIEEKFKEDGYAIIGKPQILMFDGKGLVVIQLCVKLYEESFEFRHLVSCESLISSYQAVEDETMFNLYKETRFKVL